MVPTVAVGTALASVDDALVHGPDVRVHRVPAPADPRLRLADEVVPVRVVLGHAFQTAVEDAAHPVHRDAVAAHFADFCFQGVLAVALVFVVQRRVDPAFYVRCQLVGLRRNRAFRVVLHQVNQ